MSGPSKHSRGNKPGRSGPLDAVLALRDKFGGGNGERDRGAGKNRARASFNLRNRLILVGGALGLCSIALVVPRASTCR